MPTFYDPANLTPQQVNLFPQALAEYERVMAANRDRIRALAEQTGDQRRLAMYDAFLKENKPGPKSALFARLLAGKPAFAFAPPTSFAYPWYELLETGRAAGVELGGTLSMSSVMKGDGHADCKLGMLINQGLWGIVGENAAAAELMALAKSIATRDWQSTPAILAEVRALLAKGPEWIVRHGESGNFRLYLGRCHAQGRRDYVMRDLIRYDFTGGNPVLKAVVQPYEQARARELRRIATLKAKPADALTQFERLELLGEENHVAPANPADFDWVLVERDGWCMERAPASA